MPGDARTSPASFLCDTTGETVTVTVVAVGSSGLTADFDHAPTTTVLLDGVISAPTAPTIAQNLIATPTGYQFSFNQLAGLSADMIDDYQVWRNTTNTSGTASRFQYFKHNPLNSTAVVVTDVAPNGTTYFYWVSAVNTTGLESTKTAVQSQTITSGATFGLDGNPHVWTGRNLVFNSDFSIYAQPTGFQDPLASSTRANDNDNSGAAQNTPNGWTRIFESSGNGEGVIYRSSTTTLPSQGSYALVLQDRQSSTNDAFSAVSDAFPVTAGKLYRVSAMVNAGLGGSFPTHARWFFRILFYKTGTTDFTRSSATLSANTPVFTQPSTGFTPNASTGYLDIANSSTLTGTQTPAATVTAPSDAAWARIAFYHWNDGTATASAWNLVVGDVTCKAISVDGDAIYTVSTLLNGQGSILPNQAITFTKAAETTSTLGFSWGTQSLGRADGSTISLSSGSQSFSSLTASTTYYFYPYLTVDASNVATMNFLGPFTAPSAAQAMNAALDTRIPAGVLSDTTTSSGSGGGGTIDPGGPCPHEDELVWIIRDGADPVRMPAKDVRNGDQIKGWNFAEQKDVFRSVPHYRHSPSTMWFRVRGYLVSPCEPIYLDGQWIDAWKVPGAEKVRGLPADRIDIWVDANNHEEHNYFLDNGTDAPLLIHNPVLPRS